MTGQEFGDSDSGVFLKHKKRWFYVTFLDSNLQQQFVISLKKQLT